MAKSKVVASAKTNKGFLPMTKKWDNMGVARSTVGGTKTAIPDKRDTFKR